MTRIRQIAGTSIAVALLVATSACREPDAPGTQGSPKDWTTMYTGTDTAGGTENNGGLARTDHQTSAAAPAGAPRQNAPLTNAPLPVAPPTAAAAPAATTSAAPAATAPQNSSAPTSTATSAATSTSTQQ